MKSNEEKKVSTSAKVFNLKLSVSAESKNVDLVLDESTFKDDRSDTSFSKAYSSGNLVTQFLDHALSTGCLIVLWFFSKRINKIEIIFSH